MTELKRHYVTPIAAVELSHFRWRAPCLHLEAAGGGDQEEFNFDLVNPEEVLDRFDPLSFVGKGRVHVPKVAPTRLELTGTKAQPARFVVESQVWNSVRDFAGQKGVAIPNTAFGGYQENRVWANIPDTLVLLHIGEGETAQTYLVTPIAFAAAGLRLACAHLASGQQA